MRWGSPTGELLGLCPPSHWPSATYPVSCVVAETSTPVGVPFAFTLGHLSFRSIFHHACISFRECFVKGFGAGPHVYTEHFAPVSRRGGNHREEWFPVFAGVE